jgi:hypothetical protein
MRGFIDHIGVFVGGLQLLPALGADDVAGLVEGQWGSGCQLLRVPVV